MTFCIQDKSGLGPVFECFAFKAGRGWSVFARNLDLGESWDDMNNCGERMRLADVKKNFSVLYGAHWPDEEGPGIKEFKVRCKKGRYSFIVPDIVFHAIAKKRGRGWEVWMCDPEPKTKESYDFVFEAIEPMPLSTVKNECDLIRGQWPDFKKAA